MINKLKLSKKEKKYNLNSKIGWCLGIMINMLKFLKKKRKKKEKEEMPSEFWCS